MIPHVVFFSRCQEEQDQALDVCCSAVHCSQRIFLPVVLPAYWTQPGNSAHLTDFFYVNAQHFLSRGGNYLNFPSFFCWILWAGENNNLQRALSALIYKGVVAQLQNFVPISPSAWLYKWPQKAACSVRTLTECSQSAPSLDHNRLNKQLATWAKWLFSHLGTYVEIKVSAGCWTLANPTI